MKITCPGCNATGNVNASKISPGTNLKCPKCGRGFPLPSQAPPADLNPTASSASSASSADAPYIPPPISQANKKAVFTEPPRVDPPAAQLPQGAEETLYAPPAPPSSSGAPPALPDEGAGSGATSFGSGEKLSFLGRGGELFTIFVVNLLLTLVTLSIYRFWGKVKVRNYLYGHSDLLGERFAYHGTGKELLIGWIKAVFIFAALIGAMVAADTVGLEPAVHALAVTILNILLYFLMVYAMVGSKRYRLSRSSWYGIRFSFRATAKDALALFIKGGILTMLTLGLYFPFFYAKQHEFWIANSYFGNRKFHYDGRGKELIGTFVLTSAINVGGFIVIGMLVPVVIGMGGAMEGDMGGAEGEAATGALLLTIILPLVFLFIIALSYAFFKARIDRYNWAHTTCDGVRFESTVTVWKLLRLYTGNAFILVFTVGLGLPLVMIRLIRFRFDNLVITGEADLETIRQEAQAESSTGEGLADFMDLDGGLF